MTVTNTINVALIGSKFMGRAHSNAWASRRPLLRRRSAAGDAPRVRAQRGRARRVRRPLGLGTHDDRLARGGDVDEAIDLVDIATPNNVHAEQAIAALEAGKHVACEKPLAGTLADAEAMAAAAASASGSTFVWFNYRRVPAVALAHQLVAGGALGRIYHVRAAYLQSWGGPDTPLLWRFQGDVAGSGAHGDLNAHIIDMVRFVTGEEIVTVEGAIEHTFVTERTVIEGGAGGEIAGAGAATGGATAPSTVDDAVLFLARMSGGGLASFEASRLATGYHNANRVEIHGERGALRFDFERMNELGFYDATGDGGRAGLDDDRRHPRRRRPPVRRGVVAGQPRPRLRARLRQPGRRHPRRPRRRHAARAAARLRRRPQDPTCAARRHRVGAQQVIHRSLIRKDRIDA